MSHIKFIESVNKVFNKLTYHTVIGIFMNMFKATYSINEL